MRGVNKTTTTHAQSVPSPFVVAYILPPTLPAPPPTPSCISPVSVTGCDRKGKGKKTYPQRSLTADSICFCCSSDCGGVRGVNKTPTIHTQSIPFQHVLVVCVLLPLGNLLWAKLRDYTVSRVNPNPRQAFLMRVVRR